MKKLNVLAIQLEEFKKSIEAKLNTLKGEDTKIKNRLKKLEAYIAKDARMVQTRINDDECYDDQPKEVKADE